MPQIKASFFLSGENVNLKQISDCIGIASVITREEKDWPQASICAGIAKDVWALELEKKDGIAISDSLNELQTLLLPKCELIKELISDQSLTANVILSITIEAGDAPELVISKDNIHFFAYIDAEIGLDLYLDENSDRNAG